MMVAVASACPASSRLDVKLQLANDLHSEAVGARDDRRSGREACSRTAAIFFSSPCIGAGQSFRTGNPPGRKPRSVAAAAYRRKACKQAGPRRWPEYAFDRDHSRIAHDLLLGHRLDDGLHRLGVEIDVLEVAARP